MRASASGPLPSPARMATVSYSGNSAPAAGWNTLAADGDGGVSVVSTGGKSYLAVDVDTSAKTVTIVL